MAQRRGRESDEDLPRKESWRSRNKKAKQFATSYVEELMNEQDGKNKDEVVDLLQENPNFLIQEARSSDEVGREDVIQEPQHLGESVQTTNQDLELADGKDDVNNDQHGNDLSAYQDYQVDNMDDFDRYSDSDKDLSDCEGIIEVPRSIYLPLLCIGFYLKHKLTKVALAAHLNIIRLNENSHIKRISSVHNLLSKYSHLEAEVSKSYICAKKSCGAILKLDNLKKNPLANQPCGHKRKPTFSIGQECFVLRLPIEKQLIHFIQHGGLSKARNEDPDFRGDITSGGLYQKLKDDGVIDEFTVTIQLNTDGAEIFEKSEFTFWPLMGIINELSYKLRRSYVILLAIYYGNKKPPMKQFLEESFDEINRLKTDGFFVNNIKYKLEVIVVTVDSVARAPLYGMTLFNGSFGCGFCLAEGKRVAKGRGSVRVYPEPFDVGAEPPSLRTIEQHRRDLEEVLRTKKPVHGILGPTALSHLTEFDYIKAAVPDYLHSSCEGIFKLLINLWILPKFSKKEWSISNRTAVINKRLSELQPPYEITRTHSLSAGITKLSVWKASMFRSFFLYYFPILEDLLPPVFFEHCCQLSYGMNLLLRERVSVDDVKKVDILFRNFVREFELLYMEEEVRVNVHFVTHLAQAVLDWGCLWATSTFIPEWFNGELVKLCHGSQSVADQMAKNYLLRLEVQREVEDLISENSLPSHVLSQLKELFNLPQVEDDDESKGLPVSDGRIKLLGSSNGTNLLSESQADAIKALFLKNGSIEDSSSYCVFEKCCSFPRFKIMDSRAIFTTTSYTQSPKRVNYCALMKDDSFIFLDHILYFNVPPISSSSCQSFVLGRKLGTDHQKSYTPEPVDGTVFTYFSGQTMKLTGLGRNLVAYEINDVMSKAVVAMKSEIAEQYVVTSLVNKFETD